MNQPFTLIVDVFSDQLAQISVAVVDPFSGIYSWFYQDEGLVQEAEEFFHGAVCFLEEDVLLELRAEDYFVAADEAEVCKSYHVCLRVDQGH